MYVSGEREQLHILCVDVTITANGGCEGKMDSSKSDGWSWS